MKVYNKMEHINYTSEMSDNMISNFVINGFILGMKILTLIVSIKCSLKLRFIFSFIACSITYKTDAHFLFKDLNSRLFRFEVVIGMQR